jgi:Asp-tRNA(Asn)/Glu-tRNA(Gln) amidotransferase A subunit family amidase
MTLEALHQTQPALRPTVAEAVARIRARDPELRAFVSTRLEAALADDARLAAEAPRSKLHRLAYGLKDVWDTAAIATTGGSHRYRDRVPTESSTLHRALSEAGAVLVGKTNLSDMALAPESASYVGGRCANPHDTERTPGGSSGGAAAAIADGMIHFDWGTDIGGSIRMPAGYCGVWGMRLSTETWPIEGHFPSPPESLHYMNGQGPLARDAATMRAVLRTLAPRLRTGPTRRFEPRAALLYAPPRPSAGAWPSFSADVEPALRAAIGEVRRDHGLMALPQARNVASALWASHFEDLLACDTLSLAEGIRAVLTSLTVGDRFGDRRFHPRTAEVLLLVALGRVTIYRDRVGARRAADAYRADVASLWDRGFVVALPTCAYPAPRHGRSFFNWNLLTCSMPGNLADATGLAVPFGRFPNGMPRSLQLWGPPGSEEVLLDIAERIPASEA